MLLEESFLEKIYFDDSLNEEPSSTAEIWSKALSSFICVFSNYRKGVSSSSAYSS